MTRPRTDGMFQRMLASATAAATRSGDAATSGQPAPPAHLGQAWHRSRHRAALLRTVLTAALFAGVLATVVSVLAVDLTQAGRTGPLAAAARRRESTASTPAAPPSRRPPDPFQGSPADFYPSGAAGIVPPAPHAVGAYSERQVAHAYATVKRLLVAAHLDRSTLLAGPPDAFAHLLVPAERRYFEHRLGWHGLTAQGWPRSSRAWVTSFAPGVQLASDEVKVRGTMHADATARDGHTPVLRVKADFLFVYAVLRPGRPRSAMRVVVRDVAWVDFGHWTRSRGPLEPWWSPHGGATAGGQCGTRDGFIHPAWPGFGTGQARPSGAPVDPYRQTAPPSSQGCRPTTGT